MKITILLTSIGLSLLLLGTSVLGVFRGEAVADRISAAYFTDSIDDYTGQEIEITSEQCAPITSQITQRLRSSVATKKVTELDAELEETLEEGEPTPASYLWLRDSGLVDELEIGTYVEVARLQNTLGEYLNFDPDKVVADLMLAESEKSLAEEKRKLERANQLPPGVSTSAWGASHLAKWNRTCSTAAQSAKNVAAADFLDNAQAFARNVQLVVNSDWESEGYDKVSTFVAYADREGVSCSGYTPCARFWIETAVPCQVDLVVEFSDEDNIAIDYGFEDVQVSSPNSRKSVQVNYGGGASFYEVVEASCN